MDMNKANFEIPKPFYETLQSSMEKILRNIMPRVKTSPMYVNDLPTEKHIPTASNLQKLVETAFWASLEREEGRLLSFSVIYDEQSPSDVDTISFKNVIEYKPRRLVKLAPAIGRAKNSAAVFVKDEELYIWGIKKTTFPLRQLSLRVLDPGQLTVSFNRRLIAAITGAHSIIPPDGPLKIGEYAYWDTLIPNQEQRADGNQVFYYAQLDLMKLIVREVREMGHGGTIIVILAGEWDKDEYVNEPLYPLNEGYIPSIDCLNKFANGVAFDDWRQVEEAARSIAELSGVDGAVIMSRECEVLGFGVMLKNTAKPGEDVLVHTIDLLKREPMGETPLKDFNGSRHQSAARFVHTHKNAVAFVVSQDRTVTAITWLPAEGVPEGRILCAYQRFELTIY